MLLVSAPLSNEAPKTADTADRRKNPEGDISDRTTDVSDPTAEPASAASTELANEDVSAKVRATAADEDSVGADRSAVDLNSGSAADRGEAPDEMDPSAQREIADPEASAPEASDPETNDVEASAEETSAEETSAEETSAEETSAEETRAEETRAEETSAEETNNPESSDVEAAADDDETAVDTREGAKKDAKQRIRQHAPMLVGCLVCLGIGFATASLLPRTPQAVAIQEEPPEPVRKLVAVVPKRNEPILPLEPFESLDEGLVALGKRLFHDPALSGNGRISCATCHNPSEGGDDGLPVSIGVDNQQSAFNAPTVINASLNLALSWDGRVKSLEEQVGQAMLRPEEMASDWERIMKYLNGEPRYLREFRSTLGGPANEERIQQAIATYERSLISVESRFDQWLLGDETALNSEEVSGYYYFTKLNCIRCHQGPNVGGTMFQPLGPMHDYLTSRRPETKADLGRFHVTGEQRDRYVFRVPALRHASQTAPYFHDGSVASLEQAVNVMIEQYTDAPPNAEETRRIVLFLKSLNGRLESSPATLAIP